MSQGDVARHKGAEGDTKLACCKAMWLGTGVPKATQNLHWMAAGYRRQRAHRMMIRCRRARKKGRTTKAFCVDSHRRHQTIDALFRRGST
ncbi:unnamed protein product [Prunus armeniaca]